MDKQAQTMESLVRGLSGFPFANNFNGQAMRLAVWPMEIWLQWQADLLKAAAPAVTDWMTRRREGTEAALQALERLTACQDAKDASKIQTEWIEGETKRLESDMQSFFSPPLAWPREKAGRRTAEAERASR
jgi:hypothetical protein